MSLLLLLGNSSGGVQPNKLARFNGTTDFAAIETFAMAGTAGTLMIRCKLDAATPAVLSKTGLASLTDPDVTHYPYTDGLAYVGTFRTTRVDSITLSGSVDRSGWHWFVCRTDAGNGWQLIQATDAGTLYSVSTAAHQNFAATQDFAKVGSNNYGSIFFDGDMDRFLLFSTRLSDVEIQAVIAGGNGTSPLIRYEFSSNAGGIFADASGNGYDATISGTPTIETV